MSLKRLGEGLLLGYLFLGFTLAIFNYPQAYTFIAMFMGVGVGIMVSREHYDSVWKYKYIKLLEKVKK